MSRWFVMPLAVSLALVAGAARLEAQTLGTFVWQLQPYCNRLTVTLTTTPSGFLAVGADDRCGAAAQAGVTGAATFNPDGTVGLALTIGTAADATGVALTAVVSPATGQGTWRDAAGNRGTFALGGNTPGLPARPSATPPRDIADNWASAVDPCSTTPATTLTFCGYAGGHWQHGALGLSGVQAWRDEQGRVHLRGSLRRTSSFTPPLFVLPPSWIPARSTAFTVAAGRPNQNLGTTALVIVYGRDVPVYAGMVLMQYQADPADWALHLGEIVFTVDR